ncbi:MAG TPA: N-acetyltransferase [Acidimicrobiia bacterium]|nr:N-acetyltransferase [Acidimicrobiia bacterium]
MSSDWVADPDEHLATGWERELPSSDSLLRAYTDAFAQMVADLARAAGGRVHEDDDLVLADAGTPSAYTNAAVLRAPIGESATADTVSRITSFFDDAPGGPWLVFSPLPTPDLRPHGLGAVGHPPLMLRPPGGVRRDPPPDLEIVRVDDVATLQTLERTAIDAYPLPELAGLDVGTFMPPSLLDDDRFHFFLGLVDGVPVGTSMAHLGASMSHVEYVTASPSARGRGYGEAMTWPATLADADAPSMLIASDLGRPTYERMGYLPMTRFTLWAGVRAKREG